MTFVALTAKGQILTDGISGRDRIERPQFIQTLSPQGDTCLVISDSLGRFEIDPDLMDRMRGYVYLKPMIKKPKPKLTLDSPFDSIAVHRRGREMYLVQNHLLVKDEDPVFHYDPKTTVLKESIVKAKRRTIVRDKVTGILDSLTIESTGAWVCVHNGTKYINEYRGYSHHPGNSPFWDYRGERLLPKRGEYYHICLLEKHGNKWYDMVCKYPPILYTGPQYTEEEMLEIYGMSKVQGYHPKREFYQPDELELASPTPDFRNLLQWQPVVLTDENGVVEIPFAASDVNTEFIGLIEAVDGMGLLGCQTISFRVIKD
jgi:hypothetical protein